MNITLDQLTDKELRQHCAWASHFLGTMLEKKIKRMAKAELEHSERIGKCKKTHPKNY